MSMTSLAHRVRADQPTMGLWDGLAIPKVFPLHEPRDHASETGIATSEVRGFLRLHGRDRERFLHGQCTQMVVGLPAGTTAQGLILDAKGRARADVWFHARDDHLLLEVPIACVESLRAWLDRFIVADDVRIEAPSPPMRTLLIVGSAAEEPLRQVLVGTLPVVPSTFLVLPFADGSVTVVRDVEYAQPTYRVLAEDTLAAELYRGLRAHLVPPMGWEALETWRIAAGTPRFGRELTEQILPDESGISKRIVHFEKGCYIGQEVVAMQRYRGRPRRCVCRLRVREPGAVIGSHVEVANEVRGVLTSVAAHRFEGGHPALAVLEGAEHPAGLEVTIVGSDGIRISAVVLPALSAAR